MNKYFVVFRAECDGDIPRNDILEYQGEITDIVDIRNVENTLENKWFSDDREVVLLNFRKL